MMFQKLATYLTITLIIISALLWAAHTPQAHAIRRESGPLVPDLVIMPISLTEALDLSLAYGDGRRVDWRAAGFEV